MRMSIVLLMLLLLESRCISQNASGFDVNINAISKAGILLDKGWKFHAGDNVGWAGPEFNDSNWDTINPADDIYYLPQVTKADIGWFRLKLHLDSSLFNQALTLTISQAGASEIYLNGRLVHKFGVVNKNYKDETTLQLTNLPFILKISSLPEQVIAVRYSFNHRNFFVNNLSPHTCLRLELNEANKGFTNYINFIRISLFQGIFQIAFYLLLALLTLFLYFSFRRQAAYLYIGFMCFTTFLNSASHLFGYTGSLTTSVISALQLSGFILAATGLWVFCMGLYKLYNIPKSWLFNLSVLYALTFVPVALFFYRWSGVYGLCFILLANIEILRVLLKAARKSGSGAWLLFAVFALFNLLFLTSLLVVFVSRNIALGYLFSDISVSVLPIGLSFFIANEFARTGRSLQSRLYEIEQLSRKTITQEQEKQQILANQNEVLETQVTERTAELNRSLIELKSTQSQLIQSEKMASLGELTAGIAHEIQNPLNFVNNFSEVSNELMHELQGERLKAEGERDLAMEDEILNDIKQNLEKINHHGKRADAIVKGMLQHSRKSTGAKEPTDINVLADEYLRLAYQGLRAKDKSFNAILHTNFDAAIGKINIIPQDIGRVLLNLFNNAFYALTERQKAEGEGYKPEVSVDTKKVDGKVEIRVKDNGSGIPQEIIDKIFQPFFTTKPTGQGTGLGLSLSYDIIKANGGEINVATKEGEGTIFTIELPIKNS